jgi:hypothetical protein
MARKILSALLCASLAAGGVLVLRTLTTSPIIDILGLVATVVFAVIGFWQTASSTPAASDVDSLAEQLKTRVNGQYKDDKKANDLTEGHLPVRWSAAAENLMDGEGRKIRRTSLSGDWNDVTAQYLRLPKRRWVILGEGGAGKSGLLLELMQKLLQAPACIGNRIPVLIPLAAWDVSKEVDDFLADFLLDQYPGLTFSRRRKQADRRADLLTLVHERILPMFDGLDEMPAPRRVEALRLLSQHDEDFEFVLTSRPWEYRKAVRARRPVACTAVVEIQRLQIDDIVRYLREVPDGNADDWSTSLHEHKALADVLSTPLMVWLAGATFPDRPDELVGQDMTEKKIRSELYEGLVKARFTDHRRWGPKARAWDVDDVTRWLTYLARDVDRRVTTTATASRADHLISWWRLADAAEPAVSRLAGVTAMLTTGVGVGIGVGYLFGPLTGALVGLVVGVLIGVSSARSRLKPTTVEFRFGGRFLIGLAGGLFVGLIAGGAVFVVRHDLSAVWALAGFGLPLGIVYGLTSTVNVEKAVSPASVLKRERVFVLAYFLAYGLACTIACWILSGPALGLSLGVVAGMSGGLFNGLPWAVVHLLFRSADVDPSAGAVAWFRFFLAKLRWQSHRRPVLPWRLLVFLEDARRRGLLQQVGASYRFRHIGLVHWLVNRAEPATAGSPDHGSLGSGVAAGQ